MTAVNVLLGIRKVFAKVSLQVHVNAYRLHREKILLTVNFSLILYNYSKTSRWCANQARPLIYAAIQHMWNVLVNPNNCKRQMDRWLIFPVDRQKKTSAALIPRLLVRYPEPKTNTLLVLSMKFGSSLISSYSLQFIHLVYRSAVFQFQMHFSLFLNLNNYFYVTLLFINFIWLILYVNTWRTI